MVKNLNHIYALPVAYVSATISTKYLRRLVCNYGVKDRYGREVGHIVTIAEDRAILDHEGERTPREFLGSTYTMQPRIARDEVELGGQSNLVTRWHTYDEALADAERVFANGKNRALVKWGQT